MTDGKETCDEMTRRFYGAREPRVEKVSDDL